jgi:ABC-type lipoprotein export system ATPase subunit
MIGVSNLFYSYDGKKSIRFPDFFVNKNEQCLLLGESGSGKTTLLHLLGGLLRSQNGSVQINNINLSSLSEHELDRFRGKHIGFIFQKNHLISALSVRKNLLLAPFLAEVRQDENRVREVLSQLGLEEKENSKVLDLSHGQAQRVAIARAMINRPDIIFADEPTSSLDDKNCDRVIELLLNIASTNQSTLVIATHDQRLKSKISKQIQL